jgi:hypothetical protein
MRSLRCLTSVALAMTVAVGQMSVMTSTASAQGWDGRHGGRPGAAHATPKPAPAFAQRPQAPRVVVAPPVPRYVAQPAPRHIAPPSRPHFGGGYHARPEYRPEHRGGHYGHGGGGRVAAGVALGVGALIVGSAIASSSARASSRASDYERCASRYDSFDWDTGTYENEDGDRIVCPYLD